MTVSGGDAEFGRITLNDLATLATVLQVAVRSVATVLSGGQAGVGGRKPKELEQATEMVLEATSPGSLILEVGFSPPAERIPGVADGPELGETALRTLIEGLETIDSGEELPVGFDPGVIKAIGRFSPLTRKGMSLSLSLNGSVHPVATTIDSARVTRLADLKRRALVAPATVEGLLQMVDLAARPLQCRIDRGFLPSVECVIDTALEADVLRLLGHWVHAWGQGRFEAGADEPSVLIVHEMAAAAAIAGIDAEAAGKHEPWRNLALSQGVEPLAAAASLGGVFESDEELDEFLDARAGTVPG